MKRRAELFRCWIFQSSCEFQATLDQCLIQLDIKFALLIPMSADKAYTSSSMLIKSSEYFSIRFTADQCRIGLRPCSVDLEHSRFMARKFFAVGQSVYETVHLSIRHAKDQWSVALATHNTQSTSFHSVGLCKICNPGNEMAITGRMAHHHSL